MYISSLNHEPDGAGQGRGSFYVACTQAIDYLEVFARQPTRLAMQRSVAETAASAPGIRP